MSERSQEFDRAMDKVRDEMAREDGLNMLGELVTLLLFASPEAATAILEPKKTLGGAWVSMADWAGKHRGGSNRVGIAPDKALEIVCEYYGVKNPGMAAIMRAYAGAEETGNREHGTGTAAEAQTLADVPEPVDPFDLDALMGGL